MYKTYFCIRPIYTEQLVITSIRKPKPGEKYLYAGNMTTTFISGDNVGDKEVIELYEDDFPESLTQAIELYRVKNISITNVENKQVNWEILDQIDYLDFNLLKTTFTKIDNGASPDQLSMLEKSNVKRFFAVLNAFK